MGSFCETWDRLAAPGGWDGDGPGIRGQGQGTRPRRRWEARVGCRRRQIWRAGDDDGSTAGKPKQAPFGGTKTDGEGRFTVKVDFYGRDAALLAIDSSRKVGGTAVVPVADAKREVEIRLVPLVRVHGKLESKDLGRADSLDQRLHQPAPRQDPATPEFVAQGRVLVALAARRIRHECLWRRRDGHPQAAHPPRRAEPDLDLGTLDLPATFLARHKGKELPAWTLADARGVKKDVTLADYRGKWVLVDFWGHWCGPCVRQLGELIDLYEDHAGERDKFEVLAFHDGTVKDFSEMDAKTEHTKKTLWHGRDLPFPILLDAQKGSHGATIEAFGIHSFPTTILIDPEGKLVGEVEPGLPRAETDADPPGKANPPALDRDVALGMDGGKVAAIVKFLSEESLASRSSSTRPR